MNINTVTLTPCIHLRNIYIEKRTNDCKKRQKWRQQTDDAPCSICASLQQILQQKHRKHCTSNGGN